MDGPQFSFFFIQYLLNLGSPIKSPYCKQQSWPQLCILHEAPPQSYYIIGYNLQTASIGFWIHSPASFQVFLSGPHKCFTCFQIWVIVIFSYEFYHVFGTKGVASKGVHNTILTRSQFHSCFLKSLYVGPLAVPRLTVLAKKQPGSYIFSFQLYQ